MLFTLWQITQSFSIRLYEVTNDPPDRVGNYLYNTKTNIIMPAPNFDKDETDKSILDEIKLSFHICFISYVGRTYQTWIFRLSLIHIKQ